MFAVVVGDFKKSELIIQDLKDNNYGVAFIDVNKEKDITENCLKENRIQLAKLFIALTEDDHVNLYLCKLAKKVYDVDKTIALANYPDNIELMQQQNIDSVVCSNLFIKNSIEEILIRGEGECI
jgi:trk system potassium uptake protein TrkA